METYQMILFYLALLPIFIRGGMFIFYVIQTAKNSETFNLKKETVKRQFVHQFQFLWLVSLCIFVLFLKVTTQMSISVLAIIFSVGLLFYPIGFFTINRRIDRILKKLW